MLRRKTNKPLSNSFAPFSSPNFSIELIFAILLHLEPKDLLIICQVSKLFNEIGSHDNLWKFFISKKFESCSAKETFRKHPEFIADSQHIMFASPAAKSAFANINLQRLQNAEGQHLSNNLYDPSLATVLKSRMTIPTSLKQKIFTLIHPQKTKKCLYQSINSAALLPIDSLEEIYRIVDKWIQLSNDYQKQRSFRWFISMISKMITDQKNPVILLPTCLDKLLDFLHSLNQDQVIDKDIYKIETLTSVLCHEKIVANPKLPELMGHIIALVNNSQLLISSTKLTFSIENLYDGIVEAALKKINSEATATVKPK